jgi:L-aminopeptidase/D-esterase-like protein
VVAETYDGGLNDINGFHVTDAHVLKALEAAAGGLPAEGNVGGGTGMVCHQFKGGIGTASRVLSAGDGGFTVGVLVQCNYGGRPSFGVAGVPVGAEIPDLLPCTTRPAGAANERPCDRPPANPREDAAAADDAGSIIVIVATDAPLVSHQLRRLAVRVALGVGRMGGYGGNSSGDIFLAFSTANPKAAAQDRAQVEMLGNARMTPLFQATVQATEEAILNALLAAETMEGGNGLRVYALPHDRLMAAMKKYNR